VIYEALPALHHYDLRRLGPSALARALGAEAADPRGPEAGDGVSEDGAP
jgi:hypothetical protein